MEWETPWAPARAAGGLLGIVGGEAWRGSRGGFEHDGPVAAATVDVCRAYAADPGGDPPLAAAVRHEGVPGLAWLLPVALMRASATSREHETRVLAAAAGIGGYAVPACLAYVELAARLFAARSSGTVVMRSSGWPATTAGSTPKLCGVGAVDGLAVGMWALSQPYDLATVISSLVEWPDQPAAPWVVAAAAGLLGVRDGCVAIPAQWHRSLRSGQRAACEELAQSVATKISVTAGSRTADVPTVVVG